MLGLGAGGPWHGVRAGPGVHRAQEGPQHGKWPRLECHSAEAERPCRRPALKSCSDAKTLTTSVLKACSLRRAEGRARKQQSEICVGRATSDQGCRRPGAPGPPAASAGSTLPFYPCSAGAENRMKKMKQEPRALHRSEPGGDRSQQNEPMGPNATFSRKPCGI